MDQRLMVTLELDKAGQKFVFSVPQHCPFKVALEAIHEFQGQILEWQRIAEEREAELRAQKQESAAD